MQNRKLVRWFLCFGILGAALASGGDAVIPEVTDMPGAQKIIVSLGAEEGAPAFLVRALGDEEHRATRRLPADGLEHYKLAMIAQTAKDGAIQGFSLVTWKPASKDEEPPARAWPEIKEVPGVSARIRGSEVLMLRRLQTPADSAAKWCIELVSFRKIEAKEADDPIVRAKKEVIDEGSTRLIEDRRFTLFAPATPSEDPRYGVLLKPVWKEEGRLDGFDAQLVTTPAPAKAAPE
jgi:hypothetical protein